jgi:hypothetical protein
MRAIPFFAVVGGPIMALNFLDFAAALPAQDYTTPGWRGWRLGGRLACVVAGLALIVCTIPGWVQAQPFERRRVAWNVHVEPSWKATAEQVALWRQQGLLQDGEAWFNTSPDVLNFMAYYCDGQRGFLDGRLQLYDQTAADYVTVRKALNLEEEEPDATKPRAGEPPWRNVFNRYKVRYVIMRNDPNQLIKPLGFMLVNPEEWTPLYADGEIFIFGWNHPQEVPPPQFAAMRLNYDREAFGPSAKPVQRSHPPEPPHVREWYEAFYEAEKPHSLASNLAVFHSMHEQVRLERWDLQERQRWWDAHLLVGAAAGTPSWPAMYSRSPILLAHQASLDPPPPSQTYLTIRQIQQSLPDNPDDARAYLALGNAYYKLLWNTTERDRSYQIGFVHPTLIRHTQIVTALNQALKIDPDLEAAHILLAEHYMNCRRFRVPNFYQNNSAINYIDVEVKHREAQLRLSKTHGEPPKGLEDEVKRLKKEVENQTNRYEINAANKPIVQRAVEALKQGLGAEAQSILEKADPKDPALGDENGRRDAGLLRVKLLLSLGRVAEVREKLAEDKDNSNYGNLPDLGMPTYAWFKLLAAAAIGEYDEADKVLAGVVEDAKKEQKQAQASLSGGAGVYLLLNAAKQFGAEPPLHDVIQTFFTRPELFAGDSSALPLNLRLFIRMRELAVQQRSQEADFKTLRGWLALESGDMDRAQQQLREALQVAQVRGDDAAAGLAVGTTLPSTTHLLNMRSTPLAVTGLRWLEAGAR